MTQLMITLSLATKLGRIAYIADRMAAGEAHPSEEALLRDGLVPDDEVQEFLNQLRALALIPPKKR